jgi:hypothetical protein
MYGASNPGEPSFLYSELLVGRHWPRPARRTDQDLLGSPAAAADALRRLGYSLAQETEANRARSHKPSNQKF